MSLAQTLAEIEYPESDGKPMAETDVHWEWMVRIRELLGYRYRGQQVYVASNLLVYYVEGDPRKSVAPDAFVVKDCDPRPRRTFKIWEEGLAPDVVFEVTSRATRRQDEIGKPAAYGRIGVKELFLYDPTRDYLEPALRGFRFVNGRPVEVPPDDSETLECREIGLLLRLEDGQLRMFDAGTGRRLLTEAEAERAARDAAEARAMAAEEEIRRLREQLARQRPIDS